MIQLKGITWNHTRGYLPMVATAQCFNETHPDVEIVWHKRTLHEFGAAPVDELARHFDMVVLDHPWAGFMAATKCYLPLDDYLPTEEMQSLAAHSVGPSHRSYEYDGHQWALAIDTAGLAASYRPDLLERLGEEAPRTWEQVLALGRRCRRENLSLAIPLGPVDAISAFLSLADNIGGHPFHSEQYVVDREVGEAVLKALAELVALCPPEVFELTPVTMMDRMSTDDSYLYCPMAYSYNNYTRAGYRPHRCRYVDMPALGGGGPRGSHIGGTGLAISTQCKHPEVAAAYASRVAGAEWQRMLYFDAGGQPGHAAAWEDAHCNAATLNFFTATRETMEKSFLRPRYNGYIDFQYPAGALITAYLRDGGDTAQLLSDMDRLYMQTLAGK